MNSRNGQHQVASTSTIDVLAEGPQSVEDVYNTLGSYDAIVQFLTVYGDIPKFETQLELLNQSQSLTKTYTPSDPGRYPFSRSLSETSDISLSQVRSPTGDIPYAATGSRTKRTRERNRVAARKCRRKAKVRTDELRERERIESRRNKILSNCVVSLRGEVVNLKNEILRHSHCDSKVIQDYIKKAACDIS